MGIERRPRIGKNNLWWTLDKLLKGAGAGAEPIEIDVPTNGVGREATVPMFQAITVTGNMSDPTNLNDNNTGTFAFTSTYFEYCEADFGEIVCIKRWRIYGNITHNGDGSWKIQYYDLHSHSWIDWATSIPTRTTADWSNYSTETEVLTDKIRLVATFVDSCGNSYANELEVIY